MVGPSSGLMREACCRVNIHAHTGAHHLQQSTVYYPLQSPPLSRRYGSLPIKLLSELADPVLPLVCAISCRTPTSC
jgi:hypothetical protein